MMNSNRDHPSTPQSGPGDPARQLFNTLVRVDKFEACSALAERLGLTDDSKAYRALAGQAKATAHTAV